MLSNRVSLLNWHLFISSIPLLRVIEPYTFGGIIFNGTTIPIAYHHHLLSMDITRGTQLHSFLFFLIFIYLFISWFLDFFFHFLLWRCSGRNGRGHLYFGVDIILVKHRVKWLSNTVFKACIFQVGIQILIRLFFTFFLHLFIMIGGGVHFDCDHSCTPCATDLEYQKQENSEKRVTKLISGRVSKS